MSYSPIISLIGRPNVGKSTIFNRLLNDQYRAIAYDIPGVTRDRHYAIASIENEEFVLIDTGGFYPTKITPDKNKKEEVFFNLMADHGKIAIEESDLVLFVVDGREGLIPFDESIVKFIKTLKKDFFLVINKIDSEKQDGAELEFYKLGVDDEQIILTSSAHGRGFNELRTKLYRKILQIKANSEEIEQNLHKGIRPNYEIISSIAIIGRPNAGKSTLLNRLVGSERALVSDIAGTTVDPIAAYFDLYFDYLDDAQKKRTIKIVDTAGIRKQSQIDGQIEGQSVFRALRSISECDIAICLVDSTIGLSHQDRRLCDIAIEKGKSLIICLNKSDLVNDLIKSEGQNFKTLWLSNVRDSIPWLDYCSLITLSAKNGNNINDLREEIKKTIKVRNTKIATSQLNRCFEELVNNRSIVLAGSKGKAFKVKYASMVKSNPPTILVFANKIKDMPDHYRRYLQNGIREEFNLYNTPIHLIFRNSSDLKKKKEISVNQEEDDFILDEG